MMVTTEGTQSLYEVSPDGLNRPANCLICCQAPAREKNQKQSN